MKKSKIKAEKNAIKSEHISIQLLRILIPVVIVAMLIITLILSLRAKEIIQNEAANGLYNESRANATDIAELIEGITNYYDGIADVIENAEFKNDTEIYNVLALSMAEYSDVVTDSYIGFSNLDFIDGSGWVPEDDYDPTTRAWYTTGEGVSEMTLGSPSYDLTTGAMVVCASRAVNLKDGRSGVLSVDIVLSGISQTVGEYTPAETGESMLFDGTSIIASVNSDYVGTDVSEHTDDEFLQAVSTIVTSGETDQITTVKAGGKYCYVSFNSCEGTDWTLVSYVEVSSVLAELRTFITISAVISLIIIILMIILMTRTINVLITKPVSKLTDSIVRIAAGDFTVDIPEGGKNEIGVMNNNMHDYVEKMRDTLTEIKSMTGQLATEAVNSKNVSGDLNERADDQAKAMQQIQITMDDMSSAVDELAGNASSLASQVSDLTEYSMKTKETMKELVSTAREGQRDMENVQNGMTDVSKSMAEMNRVVSIVDESAKKIDSIVEMINSISSQTNLLSLNASIEAARAGEAGRGFAVVADEIGALARNSAESASQISAIISEITIQISDLSDKAEKNMAEINSNMDSVNTAGNTFENIFRSLDETSLTVEEMISQISNVNEIATSMAAISEEQSASSQEVTSTATMLAQGAEQVAENSRGVDESASVVSDSSTRIEDLINVFKV
ncbi:MAG: methyl-accepting chemotaxis protein [Eubacterium sp.]|nr:methyl-accepting chemotaxis protein [Eubacterium sp.]